jgi:hypothetical protein
LVDLGAIADSVAVVTNDPTRSAEWAIRVTISDEAISGAMRNRSRGQGRVLGVAAANPLPPSGT